MDKQTANPADKNQKAETGDVPDKQLHRWKDEGGALPPEPAPSNEPEATSTPPQ